MLEILASVQPCHDREFSILENLVMEHVTNVSGCICVMLAWDEARHEFVKKLQMLGLPLLVLVIAVPGQKGKFHPGPMASEPERFHVLEAGRVEQGLAQLA
jgi:hypothetical protein